MKEDSLPTWMMFLKLESTSLTKQEQQILRLLAQGYTYREVADKLDKGVETVKSQVRIARGRLGAKNTTHAVAIAVSLDLI